MCPLDILTTPSTTQPIYRQSGGEHLSFISSVLAPSPCSLHWRRHQLPPEVFPGKDEHIAELSSTDYAPAPWPLYKLTFRKYLKLKMA